MKQTKKPGKIKAALLDWLGVPIGLSDTAFWQNFGTTAAGQTVNEKSMMQLSAVWSCVRLISETIATLPCTVYEKTENGRKEATNHPIYPLVHIRPNADTPPAVFWESLISAMLLRGNGFARFRKIGNRLVSVDFLSPNKLTVYLKSNGDKGYRYVLKDGTQEEVPDDQIFRVPGFTLDGDWGVSTIEYGAQVFGSALGAVNAANSTFEHGLAPTVAFTIDRIIKPEQREDFRNTVAAISGALNAGKSPVLEAGMDAKTIGIKPSDAQLLESRNFSVEEICRWFRVPPHMVGHTSNSTSWGTGIEQQMIGFLTFTLLPWIVRLQQYINMSWLSPADQRKYYVEFSLEGLLRADSTGRANYLSQMVNNGLMTRDEGRIKENLPAKGGNADVLTVQSALIPIDRLGENYGTQQNSV